MLICRLKHHQLLKHALQDNIKHAIGYAILASNYYNIKSVTSDDLGLLQESVTAERAHVQI